MEQSLTEVNLKLLVGTFFEPSHELMSNVFLTHISLFSPSFPSFALSSPSLSRLFIFLCSLFPTSLLLLPVSSYLFLCFPLSPFILFCYFFCSFLFSFSFYVAGKAARFHRPSGNGDPGLIGDASRSYQRPAIIHAEGIVKSPRISARSAPSDGPSASAFPP